MERVEAHCLWVKIYSQRHLKGPNEMSGPYCEPSHLTRLRATFNLSSQPLISVLLKMLDIFNLIIPF
jgi:hypothetical protein